MEVTGVTSPTRVSSGHAPAKLLKEIVDALVPTELARSLVVPLVIFGVAATVTLAFDRGYVLDLIGVVVLLASRAAYRAGVREGEHREALRCSQRQYVELRRHLLED
ncbi:MAG TPA: hypothetical protein VGL18_15460 [Actinomycetota bacterium]|jgi:hypothetical protein